MGRELYDKEDPSERLWRIATYPGKDYQCAAIGFTVPRANGEENNRKGSRDYRRHEIRPAAVGDIRVQYVRGMAIERDCAQRIDGALSG